MYQHQEVQTPKTWTPTGLGNKFIEYAKARTKHDLSRQTVTDILYTFHQHFAALRRIKDDAQLHEACSKLSGEILSDSDHKLWGIVKFYAPYMKEPLFDKQSELYAFEDSKVNTNTLTYGK